MSNDKALQVSQKATFNVQYSEKLAVYHFVKNLTGKYGENPFKKEFEKSKYHEKKYLDLLAQFDNLKIDYLYSFFGLSVWRKNSDAHGKCPAKTSDCSYVFARFQNSGYGFNS